MGDLADDDRHHGMGIVIEYAGYKGKPQWLPPKPFKWNYAHFGNAGASSPKPDETFEMLFEKQNAALDGFNQWTINGVAYSSRPDDSDARFPSAARASATAFACGMRAMTSIRFTCTGTASS